MASGQAPRPAEPDLVGVALGSLTAGATAGAGMVAAGVAGFRPALAELLPLILFAGILVAATAAWLLAAPIQDWWRRGVTAALAVFAALLLATLTAPADMLAGRRGVAGVALIAIACAVAAGRYARARRA